MVQIVGPRNADAEMDVARGLGVAGLALALGVAALGWAAPPSGGKGVAVIGALLLLGLALMVGALGLIAWAANGPHSNQKVP